MSTCRFHKMSVADVCDWMFGNGVSHVPVDTIRRVQHKVVVLNLNGKKFADMICRDPHLTDLNVEGLSSRIALKISQNWKTDFCHIGGRAEGRPWQNCGTCAECRGE
eukprot:GEMP01054113.1.p1 GENE.GEMP01054113.1~~GEMP01054113.1.p1  ORF type:complete len:107 (+),score=12.05 GEMP01054113.1:163-483(+)